MNNIEAQTLLDKQGQGLLDAAHRLALCESKLHEAQRLQDQHAYEFKQLRDELNCPGSDLLQLLAAIEELRKDGERLGWHRGMTEAADIVSKYWEVPLSDRKPGSITSAILTARDSTK